jgi:5-methylcytosine-specific restriction endonuclease McrBC regulatory subunit McrC
LLSRVINGLNLFKYIETSFNNDNNVDINILMFMFPLTLKNALRKGLYKTYRRNEYNNSNIKGTIDFSRHIKLNIPFVGNVAYSQREFSFDNPITQLIRHTIECIKKKTFGCELLNLAKDDVRQIVSVTQSFKRQDKSRVISSVRKNTAISAYFSEYRQLVKLCLMILQHDGQKLGNGGHEIYGVLFDCAWLWEEYVNTLICEMFIHPQNKSGKGGRKLLWTDDNEDIQTIYPDFIGKNIKDGKGIKVIADAKYKPYGVNKIDRDDYYQVLAYMFRFDASVGLYIYPEDDAAKSYDFKRQHLYTGFKDEKRIPEEDIYLIKAGIKIPKDAKDGDDFIQKMSANEDEFVKRIKRIVG